MSHEEENDKEHQGNGHNGHHRRPGDVIETFGDVALGMVGAMGKGLAAFTKKRREQKEHNEKADFLADASAALVVTLSEAQDVAGQMQRELDEKR
jgi:hypothetical protein